MKSVFILPKVHLVGRILIQILCKKIKVLKMRWLSC